MKKILSLTLAVLMVVSMIPTAFAAEAGGNWAGGTQVSYTADTDANRSYTITVPAKMTPKLGEEVSGTVTLSGSWASNEAVKVTADAEVELVNSINANDKHKLAITFPTMEHAGDNTEAKTYEGTVTLAAMPAEALFGTWSGVFNYQVELVDNTEYTTFTIVDVNGYYETTTINVLPGTTWGEYCDSLGDDDNPLQLCYNDDGGEIVAEFGMCTLVYDGNFDHMAEGNWVHASDVIENRTYYIY